MAADFKVVAITAPECADLAREAADITAMLASGEVDFVHIRKPEEPAERVRRLIELVPEAYHGRLRLHGHFELTEEFGLAGVQVNSRCPEAPQWARTVTRSCHSVEELAGCGTMEYATLSPAYPSISKPGYGTGASPAEVPADAACPVIALGGVTPERFGELAAKGYAGAAMLGRIWADDMPLGARLRRIRMMRPGRFALQYITDGATAAEVEREVAAVLEGGCRWVQIRMKDASDAVVADAVERVLPLCRRAGALLLLDDRVDLCAATGADGVHLGKGDMAPAEARKILGEGKIIGSTANSFADIGKIADAQASDYLGVGPLRFTTTKKRLAPTLGLDGYREIFASMAAGGIDLPVVAIGGVTPADVEPLRRAGAQGVAVSGDIRRAPSPAGRTSEYLSADARAVRPYTHK